MQHHKVPLTYWLVQAHEVRIWQGFCREHVIQPRHRQLWGLRLGLRWSTSAAELQHVTLSINHFGQGS